MCYSQQSVKRHVSIIMKKLKADSRTHAVALALRRGLISLPDKAGSGGETPGRHANETRRDHSPYDEVYSELKREIALLAEQVAMLADLIADNGKYPANLVSYQMMSPRRLRRGLNLN
jgi:hypothetical protein